jgi:hypothetical protein
MLTLILMIFIVGLIKMTVVQLNKIHGGGGANILLTRVQACAKQLPAIVPLNSID